MYQITDITFNTGYSTLDINNTGKSSDSPFTNNEDVTVSFVVTGDRGDDGTSGTSGTSGSSGTSGTSGTSGSSGTSGFIW